MARDAGIRAAVKIPEIAHSGGDTIGMGPVGPSVASEPILAGNAVTGNAGHTVFHMGRGSFNPVISDGRTIFLTGYSSLYALRPSKKQ